MAGTGEKLALFLTFGGRGWLRSRRGDIAINRRGDIAIKLNRAILHPELVSALEVIARVTGTRTRAW